MSNIALSVHGLGKQYRLGDDSGGGTFYRYKSLRDTLGNFARRPIKTLTKGRGPLNEANSFWALKDVDFEVKRGEVVGIIGRNGAGKSTLLKILSRITKPTTGHIELRGRVGSLLEVGTGFHPELSGRENVYLNGAILGMTRAEVKSKFDEIVAFSEIEKFLDMPVKQYSSGMYTRLAFAVAAHLEPEILVVDEVLAVGDVAFQDKCLGKMKDVSASGRTVLFVSHNVAAVRQLCDSGVVLSSGRSTIYTDIDSALEQYMAGARLDDAFAMPRRSGNKAELIAHCRADKDVYDVAEPKTFTVGIRQNADIPVALDVNLEIYDASANHVMTFASRLVNLLISTASASSVRFVVRSPWLAPGVYTVNVRLIHHVVFDAVEDACRFVVEDVYPYPGVARREDVVHLNVVADVSCSSIEADFVRQTVAHTP